ncbi:MAG TPA: PAS domain-containing sensor histidine kinase [Opitutaceae bacterium]|nr:PAS domain-containing sensor histidine kinase [Opitutaceae bacterium]
MSAPHSTALRRRPGFTIWMRVCRIAALQLLASVLTSTAADAPAAPADEAMPVIKSAADFWGMGNTAGDRVFPLRGTIDVLYYDSDWNVLWATWGGVGCYLPPGTKPLSLRSGQRVELEGFAQPGRQQILWERTSIRVVDEAPKFEYEPMPDPVERPLDYNLRLVSIEGLVCEQNEVDGTHSRIVMVSHGARLTAQVYVQPDSPVPQLRGAFVRMKGVFSVKEDVSHRTLDFEMWVSDVDHIEVLSWLASDSRFDPQATPMEQLSDTPRDQLVRVEGIVHAVEPGVSVTVRASNGETRVMTRQPSAASPGDAVEAIGFPAHEGLESRLSRGIVRLQRADRVPAEPGSAVARAISKLRLTEQVRQLDPAEAERGYPADVRGVVTWIDPVERSFFIVDSSGGVEAMLPADGSIAMPEFGIDVIVRGETRPGNFVPVVRVSSVTTGMSRTLILPAPKSLTFERAMTGSEYGEWSEIRGYVHSVAAGSEGLARIELTTPGGQIAVQVRGLVPESSLVGALINAQGICDVSVNNRRQLTGVQFLVSSPDLIKVDQRPPSDIFETPRRSIGSLLQFGASRAINHRVQVSGIVALHRPGAFFYLEDGADRLLVLSRQEEPLKPGERVDVVGIPGNEGGRLVMRDAVYRSVGSGPAPTATPLEDAEIPRLELDGMTVQLRGQLLDESEIAGGTQLRLKHDTTIFEAFGPTVQDGTLIVGSILEVKGVYRVQFDEYRQPRGFAIDLRTPTDVRVVERPSWWTPSRLLWVGCAMIVAVLLTAGWGLSLARKNQLLREADCELHKANEELETRVADRTRDLRLEITQRQASEETLAQERRLLRTLIDSLPVYLYVKDTGGRFVIGNLPHAKLLGADSGLDVAGKSDFELHPPELAKRYEEDDQRVLRTGESLLLHEEPSNILGKPGWFSTTKVPLRDGSGTITGLIGISQDITERKIADSERDVLQQRFAESSRRAGMAEVATGVLHNVGNVLNSVNVSAGVLRDTLRASEVSTLSRVAALLREHAGDMDEFLTASQKGRMLPGVVIQLAEQLEKEHATLNAEQTHLLRNVEHIKSIVAMQQNYATVSGIREKVRLVDLLRDVLQMHAVSFARHGIEVARDFEDLTEMILDKHKVMQILVNLVTNARQAIDGTQRRSGRIHVSLQKAGDDRVRVSISDDGVGIPPENFTRIFSHGFTTRQDGHGFGLHSGALAAREMGGSLTVESAGAGMGATFVLELPFHVQARTEVASNPLI